MVGAGHPFRVMSQGEEDTLHRNMLRIIAEVGLHVENDTLLERVEAAGGTVDGISRRVTYPEDQTEVFLASLPHYDWAKHWPTVSADASIFHGRYLDPVTDSFLPLTVERARSFYQVARALPHAGTTGLLGSPFEGTPGGLEPLYEKYWAWRLGTAPGGAIHDGRLCPYIAELFEVHAAHQVLPLSEVFAANVWLSPPLKLGRVEAAQVAWFLERGLRVGIGTSMVMGGASGPATLAGMVAVTLAECILIALMNRALFGQQGWAIHMSVTAMDARTAMRPYGRSDMALANLIGAQMARRYGVAFAGHCGLTDAMRPSRQAAAQKLQSALPTLLAGGSATVPVGLLGVDEIFSPLQLVLDDQLVSALGQFTRAFEVSDDSIGFDTISTVGPGGNYLAEPHSAEWLRREVWEPDLWARRTFAGWRDRDGQTDIERARARLSEIMEQPHAPDAIGEDEQRSLERVVQQAHKALRGEKAHEMHRS